MTVLLWKKFLHGEVQGGGGGGTYVMITYVSKENNLVPGDKIRYIWGLKGPILFCKAQLVVTNFLYPYQVLSFYEIESFTRALRNTDH